jgi:hypothetical protein
MTERQLCAGLIAMRALLEKKGYPETGVGTLS